MIECPIVRMFTISTFEWSSVSDCWPLRAILSVLQKSGPERELLVVDDNLAFSKDRTVSRLLEMGSGGVPAVPRPAPRTLPGPCPRRAAGTAASSEGASACCCRLIIK